MHEEQGHDRHEWYDDSQPDSKDEESQDPAWQHPGTLAWTDDRNERVSADTDAKEEPEETTQQGDRQEYEAMDIPEHWLPLPLFLVRNIPARRDVNEDDVKRMVESVRPLKVHSVAFDQQQTEKVLGKRTALVRLEPLPLPWLPTEPDVKEETKVKKEEEEGPNYSSAGEESREGKSRDTKQSKRSSKSPKDGDTNTYANWAVQKLRSQNPSLQIGGESVNFEPSTLQVQLYIGNLSPEWQEDIAFVHAMSEYGALERAYVMRNSAGLSKGYGFVEFSLPSAAMACKRAMDEIERNMRPDPKKAAHKPPPRRVEKKDENEEDGKATEKDDKTREEERARAAAFKLAGWPEGGPRLVKLLRAEWASLRTVESMFSKVLYVANLRTHTGSQGQLKDLFSQFGKVSEVTVPKNKATNSTKGFAFVLYENGIHADSAFRALEKSGSEEIGGALVSFANSAKQVDYQGRNGMNQMPRPNNPVGRVMPAIRPGPGPPVFPPGRGGGGRGLLPGRGPVLTPGRGLPGRGRGFAEPTDPYRSQLQIQQDLQAQQARMQAELEQRLQNQMQTQLRQAQLQLQQAQQQTQLLQRQALQAQAKAAQEAEARKRAEEEVRRAAAMAIASKPPMGQPSRGGVPGFGGMGDGLSARGPQSSYGGYGGGGGSGGGGLPARFSTSQAQGYGQSGGYGQGNASSGFNASSQGYGSQAGGLGGFGQGNYSLTGSQGYGAGDTYGSGGGGSGGGGAGSNYAGSDYEGSAYGGQGGYNGGSADALGYGQGGYEQGGSYEQGYGYGGDGGYEGSGNQTGYGGGQSEYGAPGYGQGSVAGYGESSVYGQSGYGEYGQQNVGSANPKRSNPYAQPEYGSGSGGYGAVGDRAKRGRY